MRVYAHRNLRKQVWSLTVRGRVVEHADEVVLEDVEFRVRPGGHRRALREGRRNVHAFAIGHRHHVDAGRELIRLASLAGHPVKSVRYDLERGAFVDQLDRPISGARIVRLAASGAVYAWDLELA